MNHELFKMKYFFVFLFLVFAAVQYNDADGWLWALAYLNIAFIIGSKNHPYKFPWVVLSLVVFSIWTLSFVPDFWHWIQMGSPSITGKMKAESPEIELVREFLGLVICDTALGIWLYNNKKKSRS